MKRFVFPKRILFLATLSGLAIIGISLMKNAMELEDAEQAYYSQWWRWGYDDQPPLYTWLQLAVNTVFGVSKISFSLVRGIIFSSILVVLYRFASKCSNSRSEAISAVLLLATIPTFIDFTFRRLSHTALLCLVVLSTYYIINKLVHKKSFLNYTLLGLVLSAGLLAKYNFVLVLMALGIAVFWIQEIKYLFLNPKILVSFLVVGLLLSPHLLWLFDGSEFVMELQSSINSKTMAESNNGIPIVTPLFTFVLSFFKLLGPLLILGAVFFFLKKIHLKQNAISDNWLQGLLVSQLLILILVFVVMGVQKVEARWLLPLLIPFVVLLPKYLKGTFLNKFNRIGFFVFLLIVFFQVVRTPIEKATGIPSSVHFGFEEISEKLQTDFGDKKWFLPDVTYAGNIRLLNQEREVFALDDFSLPSTKTKCLNRVLVVKNKGKLEAKGVLKDSVISFGKDEENLFFYVTNN